ncbi:hypothetical protein OSG_eHP15_00285 [environmental Halophage eHP-15]|nr:hypothetical protein OSG_eHP15_00285 [environmental Halophage eHP-15]
MSDLDKKEPGEYCNARKTNGDGYCQHEAGWGTDHTGHGRCKFHGGNTEAQEKNVIGKLQGAAADAAVGYKLRLKHIRAKVEAGETEEIDWQEFDRMSRTVFDRTGYGKTETHELTGEDGDAITVESEVVTVTTDE